MKFQLGIHAPVDRYEAVREMPAGRERFAGLWYALRICCTSGAGRITARLLPFETKSPSNFNSSRQPAGPLR